MVTFGHGYLYRSRLDVTFRHLTGDYTSRLKQKENHTPVRLRGICTMQVYGLFAPPLPLTPTPLRCKRHTQ